MIAILQPIVPHYRENFFKILYEKTACDVYTYEREKTAIKENFNISSFRAKKIRNLCWKDFLLYSPAPLLSKKYRILVLMLHVAHLTTWMLLLTKPLHKKKIILWGHGISVKRYLKQEKRLSPFLKMMIRFSDGVWVYTEKEKQLWNAAFPEKPIAALYNTISDADHLLALTTDRKHLLKEKYGILQPLCFIFCARFDNPYRRPDLLIEVIEHLPPEKYAFIIVGDGKNKPDLKKYPNVYDFGQVYDRALKNDLFFIADLYFQPAWTGLSIVEAMAYGIPVITFKRSEDIFQCVEYAYIKDRENGIIVTNTHELTEVMEALTADQIRWMGKNARLFVRDNLKIHDMVSNALTLVGDVRARQKTETSFPKVFQFLFNLSK